MAYQLITNLGEGSPDGLGFTTSALNTTGSNLIVVLMSWWGSTGVPATTLSDSKSNTYTALTNRISSTTDAQITMFYKYAPTVGTGHTWTATNGFNSSYPSLCVAAFSGAAESPFDTENGSNGGDETTSLQVGSVTPSENNELIITGIGIGAGNEGIIQTVTINLGFTITNTRLLTNSQHFGSSLAYLIQTTAAAVNPTWSWAGSGPVCGEIATFKASVVALDFLWAQTIL